MKHATASDARPPAQKYDPAKQDVKRRLIFRNVKTGERVLLDGGTFGDYCDLLAWDPANVQWVDQGKSRHPKPVYQSVKGWAPIARPLKSALAREEVG